MSDYLWLLIALVLVFAWLIQRNSAVKCQQLSPEQLQKMLAERQKIKIIDVRTPLEYSAGHIPEAKLRPLTQLNQWAKEFSPEMKLVLVCASGHRSTAAIRKLAKLGFGNLYNLQGGMGRWNYKVVK